MKRIFIMLLLLAGIAGQTAWAGEQPADSGDTSTQQPRPGQDSGSDGKAPEKDEEEEEPDCE